jgi:DegV family protein with EDD domain
VAVRIVTDSTADLPADVVTRFNITVVPLHIYFGDEQFEDGVSITSDEFYRRLATPDQPFPRTSAPSAGEFAVAYERIGDGADDIVSIHLSPKLSATYTAAAAAAELAAPRRRITVVDSATASLALGLLVLQAATMSDSGASARQIVAATESSAPRTRFFGVLETLEYLRRGGRIGSARAFLGALLHTKPLVGLRDGVAYPIERIRGRQRALERIIQMVAQAAPLDYLAVGHTTDEEGMEALAQRLSTHFPSERILRTQCGATLGSYLGPGAFGVAFIQSP